jgi:hypothetical protein
MQQSESKYIYLVKWWPSFPASEYGGGIVLIAADDEECKTIIRKRFPHEVKEFGSAFEVAVFEAKKLELAPPTLGLPPKDSEILEEFTT